jgi:hypothetical protein
MAIGHERVLSHVDSEEELMHAVMRQWEIVAEDDKRDPTTTHHYIGCVNLDAADKFLATISATVSDSAYYPIVQNVKLASTCYLMLCTLKDAVKVSKSSKSFIK